MMQELYRLANVLTSLQQAQLVKLDAYGAYDGCWYRVEVKRYSVADEWGDHSYTSHEVYVQKYQVVKYTPKGVWIDHGFGGKSFVLGTATRQQAAPTMELAIRDCLYRLQRKFHGDIARANGAITDIQRLYSYANKGLPL